MSLSKFGSVIHESVSSIIEDQKMSIIDQKRPDWLTWLFGDSPLLGQAERNFISDVRNLFIQEVKSKPSFSYGEPIGNKLSVLKDNFFDIVQYLKNDSHSNRYFVENYPRWKNFRENTISQLKRIERRVEINRRENAETRQAGSSLSLVGGLICLATGGVLGLVGKALIGFGTVGSFAASVTEDNELRKMIKEAEQVIQEDKECSEKLWKWISDLSHIQDALNTIRNIKVDKNVKKTAEDLLVCFKNKTTPEDMKMVIKQAVTSLNISYERVKHVADVIGILIAQNMLFERFRPLFQQALEAYRCYMKLSTAYNLATDAFKMSGAVRLSNIRKSRIFAGIALDVLNIILASKDLESTSKEAEEIAKAEKKLEEEAQIFQRLYDSVKNL